MAPTNIPRAQRRSVGNKLISLTLWGLSAYASYQFLSSLAGTGPAVVGLAVIVQAAFTYCESPLWRGEVTPVSICALILDTFTNIGGLFYYIGNLERSSSWQAFATTFGASRDVNGYTQLFLSVVLGVMLAAAPEVLWKQS